MAILLSLALLTAAALCEIASRYLAWQWLKAGWSPWAGVGAAAAIFASIALPVLQSQRFEFGRSTAGYGVLFVVLALGWSWRFDHQKPDAAELAGAGLCLVGLLLMMRGAGGR